MEPSEQKTEHPSDGHGTADFRARGVPATTVHQQCDDAWAQVIGASELISELDEVASSRSGPEPGATHHYPLNPTQDKRGYWHWTDRRRWIADNPTLWQTTIDGLLDIDSPSQRPNPAMLRPGPISPRPSLNPTSADGGRPSTEERERDLVISVVVPVYKPQLWFLMECVDSVRSQTFDRWELCLCDDGSQDPEVAKYLNTLPGQDHRIKVQVNSENAGISAATNDALSLASGTFLAFLDHDDVLDPHALQKVASAIVHHEQVDIVYTDEDKWDMEEHPCQPHFKPAWSPDLLLTYPYMGHLTVVRRDLVSSVGGLRSEFDGSQDYDLMLRATEVARNIVHIPEVLYHWRQVEGSAAGDAQAKPWAHDASLRALTDAVDRRGIDATVVAGPHRGWYSTRRSVDPAASVSVIIPFRDQAALLRTCVETMTIDPGHRNFELVLVDNDSSDPETLALIDQLVDRPEVRLYKRPGDFNWSAINNDAARTCASDYLLFANNDLEAHRSGWMKALLEHAQRPEIGAVGARLLYPDRSVQHCGVIVGAPEIAAHLNAGLPSSHDGYMGWASIAREYSAVTAACMMTRREVFEQVGGFDEELIVAFNDVDFCLRLGEAGYRVIYTPHAELIHHESRTRGTTGYWHDIEVFIRRWEQSIRRQDPYFSPNLSRLVLHCVLRPAEEDYVWESKFWDLTKSFA